jgi:prepilin-type N-terminal cleavage/methylation domain-containing protein
MTFLGSEQPTTREAARRQRVRRAVTLVEMLVVLAIIALLAALLFPAVLYSIHASRTAACDNNVRQIELALESYRDVTPGQVLPQANNERLTGWAIVILPFIEEQGLADQFDYRQPPDSPRNLEIARQNLPRLYVCPVLPVVERAPETVGICDYVLIIDDDQKRSGEWRNRHYFVKDARAGSRFEWTASPEVRWKDMGYDSPHGSALDVFGRR